MIDVSFEFVAVLLATLWFIGFGMGYVCGRYGKRSSAGEVEEVNDD